MPSSPRPVSRAYRRLVLSVGGVTATASVLVVLIGLRLDTYWHVLYGLGMLAFVGWAVHYLLPRPTSPTAASSMPAWCQRGVRVTWAPRSRWADRSEPAGSVAAVLVGQGPSTGARPGPVVAGGWVVGWTCRIRTDICSLIFQMSQAANPFGYKSYIEMADR